MESLCLEKKLDQFLSQVIEEARQLGIPVSPKIKPQVVVNRRAKKRLGCCIRKGKDFTIEISAWIANAPDTICKSVLMHEVLHTCEDCQNHGPLWKKYAAIVNHRYGYKVKRTISWESLGLPDPTSGKESLNGKKSSAEELQKNIFPYGLQCVKCGAIIKRKRRSKVIDHPELFRCRCGGKLKPYSMMKG